MLKAVRIEWLLSWLVLEKLDQNSLYQGARRAWLGHRAAAWMSSLSELGEPCFCRTGNPSEREHFRMIKY